MIIPDFLTEFALRCIKLCPYLNEGIPITVITFQLLSHHILKLQPKIPCPANMRLIVFRASKVKVN